MKSKQEKKIATDGGKKEKTTHPDSIIALFARTPRYKKINDALKINHNLLKRATFYGHSNDLNNSYGTYE